MNRNDSCVALVCIVVRSAEGCFAYFPSDDQSVSKTGWPLCTTVG